MKNIKLGLKLWSNNYNLVKKAKKLIEKNIFHYIELKVIPNTEISYFQETKVPYIIHVSSEINIADKKKEKDNLEMTNICLEWKNKLNAEYLIFHPDFGLMESAIKFLDKVDKVDKNNILIENMTKVGLNNKKMIGYNSEQMKKIIGNRFGFCLDFNHAVKAALSLSKDYKSYIRNLLKLNPKVCHISDGTLKNEKDEHLSLLNGEYDLSFFADCIRKSNIDYVTMETPKINLNSLEEDVNNLNKFKSLLASKK